MLYAPLHLAGCFIAYLCCWASRMVRSEGLLRESPRKLVRLGYLPLSTLSFEVLCNTADFSLFACILTNSCHLCISCYHRLGSLAYSMRPRSHKRAPNVQLFV